MIGHFPPFTTMQELNLDWILTKVKNLLRFLPDDGAVGQILRRTRDGAEWSDEQGAGGAVNSVNGQTGDVVLDADDVGALPDTYTAPVTSVNGETGDVVLDLGVTGILGYREGVGTVTLKGLISMSGYSGVRIDSPSGNNIRFECTKSTIGLGNVDNVRQYSASNPPPYPVRSVNGKTGAVVLDADDVGALPDTYTAPVSSVNGQTGAVVLDADDVGALPDTYTAPVTSVNGQTGDVVIQAGGVQFVKLWENSSPTNSFAAQDVSVDLSSYSWFAVKYRFSTSTVGDYPLSFFSVDDHQKIIAISASGNNRTGGRSLTYSTTNKKITFGGASYNGSTNNANAIPVVIYGIGGVSNA